MWCVEKVEVGGGTGCRGGNDTRLADKYQTTIRQLSDNYQTTIRQLQKTEGFVFGDEKENT